MALVCTFMFGKADSGQGECVAAAVAVMIQITLPGTLMKEEKRAAEEMGVSVAEFIRQTMSDRLRSSSHGPKIDPFDSITGLVESDEADLSGQIDQALYV
jgi:hypothetical protein